MRERKLPGKFNVEQSHPLEVEEARLYGQRAGSMKKRNGFRIIIAETRGASVITII
jgi:hypothetical protein